MPPSHTDPTCQPGIRPSQPPTPGDQTGGASLPRQVWRYDIWRDEDGDLIQDQYRNDVLLKRAYLHSDPDDPLAEQPLADLPRPGAKTVVPLRVPSAQLGRRHRRVNRYQMRRGLIIRGQPHSPRLHGDDEVEDMVAGVLQKVEDDAHLLEDAQIWTSYLEMGVSDVFYHHDIVLPGPNGSPGLFGGPSFNQRTWQAYVPLPDPSSWRQVRKSLISFFRVLRQCDLAYAGVRFGVWGLLWPASSLLKKVLPNATLVLLPVLLSIFAAHSLLGLSIVISLIAARIWLGLLVISIVNSWVHQVAPQERDARAFERLVKKEIKKQTRGKAWDKRDMRWH
jgi:hypothetical protein